MTADLVAFLRERLDDDEQAARAATPGPWQWDETGPGGFEGEPIDQARRDEWGHQGPDLYAAREKSVISSFGHDADGVLITRADATHIARWDPARVLADVQAKRAILTAYVTERARRDAYQAETARAVEDAEQANRRRCAVARCRGLEIAVEALAHPYAAHADFDDAWHIDVSPAAGGEHQT